MRPIGFAVRSSWAVTVVACLAACAPSGGEEPPTNDPQFDWFAYEGNDPVFQESSPGADEYLNPILAGFYPDPSICRVGDDYYLVTSSFAYFPGVPIFHSTDLVQWTQIGHVLDRPSQLSLDSLGISRGIFAPTIRWHDGTFHVITTAVGGGGNFLVTAADPAGPWSDPHWLPDLDGIDPSLFFDHNGRVYIVNNGPPAGSPLYDGHRALWIREVDPTTWATIAGPALIVDGGTDISREPIWIEGPHIFKVGDLYYLIAAEGGTGDQHSEVVFRSRSVWGRFEPYAGNPILTQRHLDPARPFPVTSTGHADFVQTPNGEWWAVFLGTRPYTDDLYNTGRETFLLPVRWHDGWPVILSGSEAVPYRVPRPRLPAQPVAAARHAGNFTARDDFEEKGLRAEWNLIRTPHERWYDLESRPGWLSVRARSDPLRGRGQPSFIGRRQQHAWASASVAVRYRPARSGDEAGLAAFQNESHYYILAMAWAESGTVIRVEQRAGAGADDARTIASAPLELPADGLVYLRIDARGGFYDFYYGYRPDAWMALKEHADGTILSTKVAGGFVGTYLGMYTHAAGQ